MVTMVCPLVGTDLTKSQEIFSKFVKVSCRNYNVCMHLPKIIVQSVVYSP